MGCDARIGVRPTAAVEISIHAPQWGATVTDWSADSGSRFQSTHPSGVRRRVLALRNWPPLFQSTHPSGVRPGRPDRPMGAGRHFNPRTPVGCDPPRGATRIRRTDFNPRTPVGCDLVVPEQRPEDHISIHAPQWGATKSGITKMHAATQFQSTHPSGVRLGMSVNACFGSFISIHAPQWGATKDSSAP